MTAGRLGWFRMLVLVALYPPITIHSVLAQTATDALLSAIRTTQGASDSFNTLFGTTLRSDRQSISSDDVQVLASVVGDRSFDQSNFMKVLPKAVDLYRTLQNGCARRTAFNTMYFFARVPDSGPLNDPAARQTFFSIAGAPKFNQRAFVDELLLRNPFAIGWGIKWDEWETGTGDKKTWTRDAGSTTVSAVYSGQANALTAEYSITIKDIKVSQVTKRNDRNQCSYTGTIDKDGKTASGTYSCTHGAGKWKTDNLCK